MRNKSKKVGDGDLTNDERVEHARFGFENSFDLAVVNSAADALTQDHHEYLKSKFEDPEFDTIRRTCAATALSVEHLEYLKSKFEDPEFDQVGRGSAGTALARDHIEYLKCCFEGSKFEVVAKIVVPAIMINHHEYLKSKFEDPEFDTIRRTCAAIGLSVEHLEYLKSKFEDPEFDRAGRFCAGFAMAYNHSDHLISSFENVEFDHEGRGIALSTIPQPKLIENLRKPSFRSSLKSLPVEPDDLDVTDIPITVLHGVLLNPTAPDDSVSAARDFLRRHLEFGGEVKTHFLFESLLALTSVVQPGSIEQIDVINEFVSHESFQQLVERANGSRNDEDLHQAICLLCLEELHDDPLKPFRRRGITGDLLFHLSRADRKLFGWIRNCRNRIRRPIEKSQSLVKVSSFQADVEFELALSALAREVRTEDEDRVKEELALLSSAERQIISYRFFEDRERSFKEIANLLTQCSERQWSERMVRYALRIVKEKLAFQLRDVWSL